MSDPVILYRPGYSLESMTEVVNDEEKREKCLGVRVFYYSPGGDCDHLDQHEGGWNEGKEGNEKKVGMKEGEKLRGEKEEKVLKEEKEENDEKLLKVEAGTVIDIVHFQVKHNRYDKIVGSPEDRFGVAIKWDCGFVKVYWESDLAHVRVFDLGPTGYKGEMIFCDKCLVPVTGFAWRLYNEDEEGDLYDLCFTHYNANEDAYTDDIFYCNIPTGRIKKESERNIEPRSKSEKRVLIGMFKDARVDDDAAKDSFKGKAILNIAHRDEKFSKEEKFISQQDMRKADYYNCCAEIAVGNDLRFRSAGCKGVVDVKVVTPGEWGVIFPDHHPKLSLALLYEIATCEEGCPDIEYVVASCKCKYFKRHKSAEQNCAVIISGTQLNEINDLKVWENCDDLKIVILYMNHLTKLPEKLLEFKETITLVYIQNNDFQEIPEILYQLDKLKHFNMHGNYLFNIPKRISDFKNLTRLYLGDNDITSLPDIFDHFQNLKKASFEKNDLTRLPPSFGKLRKLETLDLSENNIVIFPQVLFDLKLRILNVERNRIQIIFAEESDEEKAISFFRNLSHLQMRNNPFIVEKQLDSKKGSLIALQNEKLKRSRSLRVNVLGNSGAGKSSLVQALTIQKYVVPTTKTEHRHTVGIERHFLPLDINGKRVVLHIWDYAGDDEYAMMNDLFITDGSLVWLVVNLAKYEQQSKSDNDEKVFYANVGGWLLQIMSHNKNPNVWIICTHRDMCSEALAYEIIHQIKRCVEKLCQGDERTSIALIKNVKYINLTNTFSFTGIEKVNEEFKNLLDSTSFLNGPLSVQSIKSIDCLQEKAELRISKFESPVISSKELGEELSDMQVFLRYYHDVGEIYKLDESVSGDSSRKMVILSPKWLISLLKLVYRRDFKEYLDQVRKQSEFLSIYPDDLFSDAPKKREKFGVISEPVLKALWKCHKSENLFKSIIMLFQKFNLTIPSSKKHYNEEVKFYFFPYCMKEKTKINEKLASSKSVIVFKCLLPHIKVKLFLQRLALKFWEKEAEDPKIHDNGFEIKIEKDVELHVLRVTRNRSNDIRIQFSSDRNIDSLWTVVQKKLQDISKFLSSYSTVPDKAKLQLGLNSCLCSVYFPLLEVTEDVYEKICPKYALKCRCGSTTPSNCAVAKSTLQLSNTFELGSSPPICSEEELEHCLSGKENFKFFKTEDHYSERNTISSYIGDAEERLPEATPCSQNNN